MSKALRLEKLEAVRGLTAFYVLIHHFVHSRNELAAFQRFFIFGQFAVLVFFILSGFVIHYSLTSKDPDMSWGKFFLARFRRIYPVFIVAMLTNYLLACWGSGGIVAFNWAEFGMNLAQLQDDNHPHPIALPFMNNHPLWSLAYEWWFYMLYFPLQATFRKATSAQKWMVGAFSAGNILFYIALPNGMSVFFAYWIIWWSGVEMAREYMEDGIISIRRQWTTWAMVAVVGLMWGIATKVGESAGEPRNFALFPYLQIRHFITVGIILVGAYTWYKLRFIGFDYLIGPFKHFAPISYALYIVHLPFIQASAAIGPENVYLDMLLFVPVILGYSWLLEQPFQKWVNRWMR